MPWRYQPEDNRTPVNHPLIGHLEWGQIYDNELCASDPNFVEVSGELSAKTRQELNDHAVEAGVEEPEKLPNKQAVIDAITALSAATEPSPAESEDSIHTDAEQATDAGQAG